MNGKQLYARTVFWPTWAWNLWLGRILKVRPWWNQVEAGVWLGARPLRRDVPVLSRAGIRAIVNTCEEFSGHSDLYDRWGIRQLYLPTTDFQAPDLEQIRSAVEFIDATLASGGGVYVHCKAGRARSATILMCWLMHSRGLTAREAQQRLLECRPHVNPKLADRAVVKAWQAELDNRATTERPNGRPPGGR